MEQSKIKCSVCGAMFSAHDVAIVDGLYTCFSCIDLCGLDSVDDDDNKNRKIKKIRRTISEYE